MSLLLLAPDRNMKPWKEALLQADPHLEVDIWPAVPSKEAVHFIVAWDHPAQVLNAYPNLKAVSSLGAGADHIVNDESLPQQVKVCRVVCESLTDQMKEFVLMSVLNHQRHTKRYFMNQLGGNWQAYDHQSKGDLAVGIMGLGRLGKPTAGLLSRLGYRVHGWSRTPKTIEGLTTYAGAQQRDAFLGETNILVCMLPLTSETSDILDLHLFKQLKKPAYIINVARGEHLVEEDLVYALDKGLLEGAALDVFSDEPLPEKHPFWNRQSITITPHVSSITPPEEAAEQIVENYKRALSGMDLLHPVDKELEY